MVPVQTSVPGVTYTLKPNTLQEIERGGRRKRVITFFFSSPGRPIKEQLYCCTAENIPPKNFKTRLQVP